jgi:glutamate-1-semialdehyde 2,1-aminomutase
VPRALKGTAIPFEYNNLDSLRAVLEGNRGEVACIIMEACRGKSPEPGYLESVRRLADEHEVVLIFDEIVTGFRMALGGAQQFFGVTPDLCTFGKALSNGIPLGAVCGRRAVMSEAANMFISSTYFSDTLGLAAGAATVKELRDRPVLERIWRLGKELQEGLNALAERYTVPFHCGGYPPAQHVGFTHQDEHTRIVMTTLYLQELVRGGILATTVTYLCYSHTEEHVAQYLQAAEAGLAKVARGLAEGNLEQFVEAGLWGQHLRRLV